MNSKIEIHGPQRQHFEKKFYYWEVRREKEEGRAQKMEYNKLIAWGRNWGELRPGGGTSWSVWLTQSEGVLAPFSLDEVLLILAPRRRSY